MNVRQKGEGNQKQCLLVLMGATAEGRRELIAVVDGVRESKQSRQELLLDLRQRGLTKPPTLALGFWGSLRELCPTTKEQRCWVHKTANVLNKTPKSLQAQAKNDLHQVRLSETREKATKAFDHFLEKCGVKYEAACSCFSEERDVLLAFYDFPAEYWGACGRPTPTKAPSPRSACGIDVRRAAV